MADDLKKRRLWPYIAVALLLLFVGGPLAWLFRPLNATERKLVGTWLFVSDGTQRMQFRADRRLAYSNGQDPVEDIATWTAAEDGLRLRIFADDVRIAKLGWYARLMASLERFRPRPPSALRFHDADRALIYGIECRRLIE